MLFTIGKKCTLDFNGNGGFTMTGTVMVQVDIPKMNDTLLLIMWVMTGVLVPCRQPTCTYVGHPQMDCDEVDISTNTSGVILT